MGWMAQPIASGSVVVLINPSKPSVHQQGFTYLGLLFLIALMGATLALTGVIWHTAQKRDKERELLFVGNQFRNAIVAYYNHSPGSVKQYPKELSELLKDPRQLVTTRYLRRLYLDPFTGKTDWGLVKTQDNRIMGVYSLSEEEPIKQSNFRETDKDLEGKMRYVEWRFVYTAPPNSTAPVPAVPAVQPLSPIKQPVEQVPASNPIAQKPFDESLCDTLLKNDTVSCQANVAQYGETAATPCAESAEERQMACRERKSVTGLPPLRIQLEAEKTL